MTEKEWLFRFKLEILSLPFDERQRLSEVYASVFAERRVEGMSEEEVAKLLGDPETEAQKCVKKYAESVKNDPEEISPPDPVAGVGRILLAATVCLTLSALLFVVLAAVFVVAVGGGLFALGGAIRFIRSVIDAFTGKTAINVIAEIGLSFAMIGFGLLIFSLLGKFCIKIAVAGVKKVEKIARAILGRMEF